MNTSFHPIGPRIDHPPTPTRLGIVRTKCEHSRAILRSPCRFLRGFSEGLARVLSKLSRVVFVAISKTCGEGARVAIVYARTHT
ncbi:hypothetical protein SAMN04515647_4400 [Cohaesibacter sp. ES.047]|nr:hypothetical protein SAMN04515647_4400 [Cohaesibacter sp. ES.047]